MEEVSNRPPARLCPSHSCLLTSTRPGVQRGGGRDLPLLPVDVLFPLLPCPSVTRPGREGGRLGWRVVEEGVRRGGPSSTFGDRVAEEGGEEIGEGEVGASRVPRRSQPQGIREGVVLSTVLNGLSFKRGWSRVKVRSLR